MTVGPVGSSPALPPVQTVQPARASESTQSFGARLESALSEVNAASARAAESARAYQMGTQNDLAAVMVEQQVSSLGFQLTLNVRNKALGAYRDIMNMPL
ncbi:MAG: flagellar hook-basal body complex protein FliE [Roseibaca calidilacus]|uniref:Flagellar hook-basal body complex protein FliE n=1 Tax=Roseibaca calidilacus TaxID=1666912 RepID=A0A0N8K8U8_9RHOB|nr:flagellar hook-basal body complex protein FliE [Roseibaca calidilacus]KPP95537.1 MAG: flagellar hook-basal body complex protein FliE [Roseibaca calidilacus]CUX82127.1 flagellar hook-basal body complex protein FliE [Roseibaca calidilacus]